MSENDFIKAAIIGHPVGHSKSPLIHNYWLKKYGIAGRYEALDVPPEQLGKTLERLAHEGYAGFNVTLPHKISVMHLCDGVDALAQAIGAVNLVTVQDGQLMGGNSDVFGFIESIRHEHPGFDFRAGPALVLGAGGATRAIVHGLLAEGAPLVRIANRTRGNAEQVAAQCCEPARVQVFSWEERHNLLGDINILVNTTSLGMDGQPPLELDLAELNGQALVADIIYKPLETKLMRDAAKRGNETAGGIGMLLHQARPAFQAWFGIMPEIDAELERLVSS
jgi:shikimate dehydrogenase